jgi:preprotein translocase subunit SecE
MATEDETKTGDGRKEAEASTGPMEPADGQAGSSGAASSDAAGSSDAVSFDGAAPAQLGITRYVHAAFLATAVTVAYVTGKVLAMIWNILSEWPAAVRALPQLVAYAEDERPTFTMVIGGAVGLALVLVLLRKPDVRRWADEVATELYKVHWPEREIVTNGTIVVLVAGLFATVYIGLLDRVWAFLTNLVYGA